jgi:peptidoglycan/LPS O-acetylase OafA/YrhL
MWLGGFSTKMYGKTAAVIFFISLGLLFYIGERDGMKNFWRYVSIICLFGVLFFCKFEKLRLSNQDFVCAFSYIIGFLISYFVITYGQNLKYNKYVNFFANISYPVFLFHQTFGTIGQGGGHTFGFF